MKRLQLRALFCYSSFFLYVIIHNEIIFFHNYSFSDKKYAIILLQTNLIIFKRRYKMYNLCVEENNEKRFRKLRTRGTS